jgi:hypothetical protein
MAGAASNGQSPIGNERPSAVSSSCDETSRHIQADADRANSNHELLAAITALQERLADVESRLRASRTDELRERAKQ